MSTTIDLRTPQDGSEEAIAAMFAAADAIPPVALALAERFAERGFALHLVGGPVRDALLGRPSADLDFTTDARPEQVAEIARGWTDAVWEAGIAFGTLGLQRDGHRLEVTTYRSESYDPGSRNPAVSFGDTLAGDLARRDFTVNAMAISLPGLVFVDPHGGLRDLAAGVLRTPGTAVASFTDDPLRMMRAARFVAQLGFSPVEEVLAAMTALADRLAIVAPERVRDELVKTLLAPDPVGGLELLVDTGLAEVVLPELPALRLSADEHAMHKDVYRHTLVVLEQAIALEARLPGGGPDLVLRLAALLHDVGKPATKQTPGHGKVTFHNHEVVGARMTRERLRALHVDKATTSAVQKLVALHLRFHGYGDGAWTDSAVRRYVTDAGDQLERLHALTRSDCTTRNLRKAARLAASYDALEERIARLREAEDLARVRPDLDGHAIMRILGIGGGPVVGAAYEHLLQLRLDRGPLDEQTATAELLRWYAERG